MSAPEKVWFRTQQFIQQPERARRKLRRLLFLPAPAAQPADLLGGENRSAGGGEASQVERLFKHRVSVAGILRIEPVSGQSNKIGFGGDERAAPPFLRERISLGGVEVGGEILFRFRKKFFDIHLYDSPLRKKTARKG